MILYSGYYPHFTDEATKTPQGEQLVQGHTARKRQSWDANTCLNLKFLGALERIDESYGKETFLKLVEIICITI